MLGQSLVVREEGLSKFAHLSQRAQHVIGAPSGNVLEGVAPRQLFEHCTRVFARPSQKNRRTCSPLGRICICFLWVRCLDSPRRLLRIFLLRSPALLTFPMTNVEHNQLPMTAGIGHFLMVHLFYRSRSCVSDAHVIASVFLNNFHASVTHRSTLISHI